MLGAIFLLLPTAGLWTTVGWWDLPLTILPNIISFTLAGYAMFMAFGDEKFKRLLTDSEEEHGPLLSISATFTHFIIIQTISISLCVIFKSRPLSYFESVLPVMKSMWIMQAPQREWMVITLWSFGFLTFLYSLTSIMAATFSIFRLSSWYNSFHKS